MRCFGSIHEFFDRLIQLVDGLLVAGLYSVGQAVVDMVFQDDLCRVVERRAYGRKLDGRDCAEVLIQIAAVRAAIENTGKVILQDHIQHCIVDAVEEGDDQAIASLCAAIDKFMK